MQDVVKTMDEVYQAGTDPLGLGRQSADLSALNAAGAGQQGSSKKGTRP